MAAPIRLAPPVINATGAVELKFTESRPYESSKQHTFQPCNRSKRSGWSDSIRLTAAVTIPALERQIRAAIMAANGAISFSQFMELALYAPFLGYYMSGAARFGSGGDFVTAPGVSLLFADAVAEQIAKLLEALDCGIVIEAGGGDGVLAQALIPRLQQRSARFSDYWIIERSPALRERQRQRLNQRPTAIAPRWLDEWPDAGFCRVTLANELLDAIPFDRFIVRDRAIVPLGVGLRGDRLVWQPLDFDADFEVRTLTAIGDRWSELDDGYVSEIAPWRDHWLARWGESVERGALLLFDYGYSAREYYHPDRRDGTLQCHSRHRMHADPFIHIGQQDISAHVNFSALAAVPAQKVVGYTTQAGFLLASEVPHRLTGLDPLSSEYLISAGELQRLVMPGEMGEAIKVMLLVPSARPEPGDNLLLGNRWGG